MCWKNTSCLCNGLDSVLRTLLGTEAPLVIPYSENEEVLWSLGDTWLREQINGAANGIVIVWEPPPTSSAFAGQIDTARYLNPLTWALCALRTFPDLHVTVVDCDATANKKLKSYQAVQAIDPTKRPFRLLANPLRYVAEYLEKHAPTDSKVVSELLTHQVRTILTERGPESSHHALANHLGPLVLMGDDSLLGNPQSQRAFQSLFKAVGLFHETASTTPVVDNTIERPLFDDMKVRLLLVDDQWEQGWDKWVSKMVKAEQSCVVKATASPEGLVDAIKQGGSAKDFRFNLAAAVCPESSSDVETMLLLDLRLFSLRSLDVEVRFVRDLLPLCQKFKEGGNCSFAWPGFGSDELKEVEQWCNTPRRDTDEHLLALSLLPRLLALVDFSLPIVLFSSTGQRTIVEELKPYGSIITDFAKPRFTGFEGPDLVRDTELAFRGALAKAAAIARAGREIRAIRLLELDQYEKAKSAFAGKKHIEIFHDESSAPENTWFRVAAFAVGFPSIQKADGVDAHIKQHGPKFYDNKLEQIKERARFLEADAQWTNEVVPPLKQAFVSVGIDSSQFLPFVIVSDDVLKYAPNSDPLALLDPSGLDNTNQELLRLLLEVMLIDTLAWIADPAVEKCCFFGATRMRAQKTGTKPNCADIAKELQGRWSIQTDVYHEQEKDGTWKFKWQSLRRDSFHGLLNELASARTKSARGLSFAGKIGSAYGTSLPKEGDTRPWPGYSHLHSIADIIARLVDINKSKRLVTWRAALEADACFPLAVRGAAGLRPEVMEILNCHRALDEDDLVDGFGYGLRVNHRHDVAGNVVALRLRELIPQLTGNDFIRIVRQFTEGGPRHTHSPRLSQRSKSSAPNRCQGRSAQKPSKPRAAKPSFAPSIAPSPVAPLSGQAWEELAQKWRIKRFGSLQEYRQSREAWHTKQGFQVRTSSNKKVIVFAELAKIERAQLEVVEKGESGFVVPDKTVLPNGRPCGRDISEQGVTDTPPTGVKQDHQSRQQRHGGGPQGKPGHKQGKPPNGGAPASQSTQPSVQQKRLPLGLEIEVVVIENRRGLGGVYARTAKGGIEGRLEWRGISKTQPQPGQRVKAEVIDNAPHAFRLSASS